MLKEARTNTAKLVAHAEERKQQKAAPAAEGESPAEVALAEVAESDAAMQVARVGAAEAQVDVLLDGQAAQLVSAPLASAAASPGAPLCATRSFTQAITVSTRTRPRVQFDRLTATGSLQQVQARAQRGARPSVLDQHRCANSVDCM